MKYNTSLILVCLALIIIAGTVFAWQNFYKGASSVKPIACTMEAKLCSDGSSVSRTGPNCEFAKCSEVKATSGITGTVLLGPTCPVERIPPDPKCAPKPYSTALEVATADGAKVLKQFNSDSSGKFNIILPSGEYVIRNGQGSKIFPRCFSNGTIKVIDGKYTDVNINCDTGIR
ncbi:MAG: hypothetical protein NTY04_03875 [Candidatus Staskawiczbacteria bacterium]|nr:hypothetical protein [Candidatus Staskawiczbacteria bacterium]